DRVAAHAAGVDVIVDSDVAITIDRPGAVRSAHGLAVGAGHHWHFLLGLDRAAVARLLRNVHLGVRQHSVGIRRLNVGVVGGRGVVASVVGTGVAGAVVGDFGGAASAVAAEGRGPVPAILRIRLVVPANPDLAEVRVEHAGVVL